MSVVPAAIPFDLFANAVLGDVARMLRDARAHANHVRLANGGMEPDKPSTYMSGMTERLYGYQMIAERMKFDAPAGLDFDAVEIAIRSAINEIRYLERTYIIGPLLEWARAFAAEERS